MIEQNIPHFERVYFIGAGFSAGLHYPVGSMLMPDLVKYLKNKLKFRNTKHKFINSLHLTEDGKIHAEKIHRIIEQVLQTYFAMNLSAIERVDVAEFFTLAQTLSERTWLADSDTIGKDPRRTPAGEPSQATLFADLAAITRSYFIDLSWAYEYPKDIDSVLRLVRREHDAVVNFNWDEDVETWFSTGRDEDVSYTFGAWQSECRTAGKSEEAPMLVLKPHGSVGWYDLQRGIGNEHAYLIAGADKRIDRYEKRLVSYWENELPLDIGGETPHKPYACPPVITAPTFGKKFDYVEQQRIWRDVLEVCRNAREFVFLGYSLPKDDFLTRAAIRAAMSQNQSTRRIRCLVVDRSFEDSKYLNFLSVFEGLSRDRNYLRWEFGSNNSRLAAMVKAHLERAFVSTV